MRTGIRARVLVALLGATLAAGCGDGGDANSSNNTGSNNTSANDTTTDMAEAQPEDMPEDMPSAGEPDDGAPPEEDMGADQGEPAEDMGAEVCPGQPRCPQGYAFNDLCQCRADVDRGCEADEDCREGESCREVESEGTTREVCWLDPDSLQLQTCPGSPGCMDDSGELEAAAVSMIITPEGYETAKPAGLDGAYMNFAPPISPDSDKWNDCGYDGLCPGDEGYVEPDEGERDGELQGMFIAGFSHGRPAQYCPEELIGCDAPECCVSKLAHDDLKVQIAVFRKGEVTIAFAVVDAVGYFHTYIDEIRARVQARVDVDLLIMSSSHSHEGPDTVGQWGPGTAAPTRPGRDPRFMQKIQDQTVVGIEQAVDALAPADLQAAVLDVGVEGLAMSDSRPPYIFDDNVPVVRVVRQDDGAPIATMLSVGNHAEVLWSGNEYLTADYFHYTREYVREGLGAVVDGQGAEQKPALQGLGGVSLVFAGAVGGLINPGRGVAMDYAGQTYEDHGYAKADAVGQRLAMHVLRAHRDGLLADIEDEGLQFGTRRFLTPITNPLFLLAGFVLEAFERDIYNADQLGRSATFFPGDPMVMSQVAVVRLGPITFFTAPGEVFPETLVGGYPNRPRAQTPVVGDVEERRAAATCDDQGLPTPEGDGTHPCIVKADQDNPPSWEDAPQGPYVYDLIPGEYPFFIGLGMDFLGYMVPSYDYEPGDAPGSHYEETNGASADLIVDWRDNLEAVLQALE